MASTKYIQIKGQYLIREKADMYQVFKKKLKEMDLNKVIRLV
jgi:hypothetical protein